VANDYDVAGAIDQNEERTYVYNSKDQQWFTYAFGPCPTVDSFFPEKIENDKGFFASIKDNNMVFFLYKRRLREESK